MNRLTHYAPQAAQQQIQGRCRSRLKLHHALDASIRAGVALVMANLAIFALQTPQTTTENSLQIVAAGVETSEDAPFVAASYRFLPGDYLYFQFQISGYAVQTTEGSEVRKMSLAYEITPEDDKNIPLTPPMTGIIKEELNAEDKNWMPKRRTSFLLPSFVSAGEFHLHVVVNDLVSHKSTESDVPFHIGGTIVVPAGALTVQDFQFLRKEGDSEPVDVAAYSPGDTLYARFMMTGFRLAAGNEYHLSYGLTVHRPDGKPYINEQKAAEVSNASFYPVPYVPGNISITTTRSMPRGQYVLLLTVRDAVGSQTYQLKRTFTIE
jgi:hypothetical protein